MAERDTEAAFISAVIAEKEIKSYKNIPVTLFDHLGDAWQLLCQNKKKLAVEAIGELPKPVYKAKEYFEEMVTTYNNIKLIESTAFVNENIGSADPTILLEHLKQTRLISFEKKWVNLDNVIEESLKRVKTQFEEFDSFNLALRQLILVAAEKKIGKSRFVIALANGISQLNSLPILAFTWEMTAGEYKAAFKLVDATMSQIFVVSNGMNIFEVCRIIVEFCEEHGSAVVIVDNIGLVQKHSRDPNAVDDDIAAALKTVRDDTGSLIFAIHHLTKSASHKGNFEQDYEPTMTDIRGSGRLQDYSNQVWMLHRPSFYDDLIQHYERTIEDKKLVRLLKKLFLVIIRLNRSGPTGYVRLGTELKNNKFWQLKSSDYDSTE